MKIGQRVVFMPDGASRMRRKITGTVVYIHPRRRFCTVEYAVPRSDGSVSRTMRRCFQLDGAGRFCPEDEVKLLRKKQYEREGGEHHG